MLVLDSSMAMVWAFDDEVSPLAEGVLDRIVVVGAHVPGIWPFEIANALLVGERRRRLSVVNRSRFEVLLGQLPIEVDAESPLGRILGPVSGLAREQGLSIYDASYLDLAIRRGLPLATLDGRLREAAVRVGVPVVEVGANGIEP